MPLNLSFSFPTSPEATAVVTAGFKVQRYELREAVSTLFELTIEVLSSDPAIDMAAQPRLPRPAGTVDEARAGDGVAVAAATDGDDDVAGANAACVACRHR